MRTEKKYRHTGDAVLWILLIAVIITFVATLT